MQPIRSMPKRLLPWRHAWTGMRNGSTVYAIYNNEGATEIVTVGSIKMKAGN